MKCKCISDLMDDSPFAINDTQELTAKKLFVYFLETFDPLADLLTENETVQLFYALLEESEQKGLANKVQFKLESLPWEVCCAFSKFLLECPHVHVTID